MHAGLIRHCCRNADVGQTQLTNGKNADASLAIYRHSDIRSCPASGQSGTVRLPISLLYIERGLHSRMEKGERGTRKRTTCMWSANSCRATSTPPPLPLHPDAITEAAARASFPAPPPTHTPYCRILAISGNLGQNRGRPPFRSLWVL